MRPRSRFSGGWPCGLTAALLAAMVLPGPAGVLSARQRDAHERLFSPRDLNKLESPDRDEWQQPDRVMDALAIAEGDRVADLGAGGGWFTIRLARRVGPNGVVYAEDIQKEMIESIARRVDREGLKNVRPILGAPDNPGLEGPLRAVLIVDTYPEMRDPVGVLRHVAAALAPNGRLGIVDFKKDGAGGPGPDIDKRIDPDQIRRDAVQAGLALRSHETFLRYQYLLVFGK